MVGVASSRQYAAIAFGDQGVIAGQSAVLMRRVVEQTGFICSESYIHLRDVRAYRF
jgi:hypothetical protein